MLSWKYKTKECHSNETIMVYVDYTGYKVYM
jgi:hypothetical protein